MPAMSQTPPTHSPSPFPTNLVCCHLRRPRGSVGVRQGREGEGEEEEEEEGGVAPKRWAFVTSLS